MKPKIHIKEMVALKGFDVEVESHDVVFERIIKRFRHIGSNVSVGN